ncbi:hypothetical protein [Dapis sp. BLCC M229]
MFNKRLSLPVGWGGDRHFFSPKYQTLSILSGAYAWRVVIN